MKQTSLREKKGMGDGAYQITTCTRPLPDAAVGTPCARSAATFRSTFLGPAVWMSSSLIGSIPPGGDSIAAIRGRLRNLESDR